MKKIYLAFSLLTALVTSTNAQSFEWAKREGLYEYDYGYGIATDPVGNVYVAGKYEMAANFSNTILFNRGNHDIYVAKYGADGGLRWISTGGGLLGDYAHALTCTGTNLFIAGEIEGAGNTISFDGSSITLNPVGDNDAFIAKYDLSGNLIWAKSGGGTKDDKAQGVSFDNAGNAYMCGFFEDSATFGNTTLYSKGYRDIFVVKYDGNGNFQWAKSAGSSGRDEGLGIKCDPAGNVYVCGMHSDGANFDSQIINSPNGYYNAFLAKYSTTGSLQWVKTGGGDVDDVAWSVTMDNAGKIYISGEYNAYAVFGSTALLATANADVFVACYDASGTEQWAKSGGGNLIDRARGITSDGTNTYISGQFGGTATFGTYNLTAADSSDIFIAALNPSGDFIWATSVGGPADSLETLGYESGDGICAEAAGNVYATGALLNGGTFGSTTLTPYSRTDAFIAKISQTTGIHDLAKGSALHIYPNPGDGHFTIDLGASNKSHGAITIYNCIGQAVEYLELNSSSKISIDLSDKVKGIYFVELTENNEFVSREKISIQ